jgi:phage-related protein
MIWLFPIASWAIGSSLAPGVSSFPVFSSPSTEDFSFDGYGLQNASIIISTVQGLHDSGSVDFGDTANNGQDGGQFIFRDWRKKTVILKGIVKSDTRTNFEAKLDEMKGKLDGKNDILRYATQGKFREINATCTNMVFDRQSYNVNFCQFVITFTINDVYWRDSDSVSVSSNTLTANTSAEYTNIGNKETYPKIVTYINSGTCSQFALTLNGTTITYAGSLTAGDVLIIDSKTKRVYKNSVVVDYTWPCPIFQKGSNIVSYNFGSGTYNLDINAIFTKNFL